MMAPTHVALGIAAWSAIVAQTGLPDGPVFLALAGLGALLPDIDEPDSTLGRKMPLISMPIGAVFGHRTITHSLVAAWVLFAALRGLTSTAYATPVVLGYLSHLAGDCCTNSGCPLLWPWPRRYSLRLFNTGSLAEGMIGAALLAGLVWQHLGGE